MRMGWRQRGDTAKSELMTVLFTEAYMRRSVVMMPRQNGHHFPDDTLKCTFRNENAWISIMISVKFVPKGPINSITALVQILALRRPGDKLLSEPMIVNLPTHICVTRSRWLNRQEWFRSTRYVDVFGAIF